MSDQPFIGQIKLFAFNFPPRAHALCNGQFLPINQNQALFSLLGTMYGGNGQTNFALPDLRSRVPVHFGPGFTQGQAAGEENHTLLISEIPQHTHIMKATSNTADQTYPVSTVMLANQGTADGYTSTAPNAALQSQSVSNTGNSQPHPNMQPYLVMNYSISLQGIFPSRN